MLNFDKQKKNKDNLSFI